MALSKYKLGELIELTTETNELLQFDVNSLRGMTITKKIIPTKADAAGADLRKYLVVHPNEFIYNPRTHGKKIGLGFNDTNETFIISWNNIAFRIKEKAKRIVSPFYLFMHFNRDEWDREACYQSWGSSTEVFSWENLCDMNINLPDLATQQKYVDIYLAMVENQKAYERGLSDLKLTCDGYIEDLRRKMPCEKIGKYLILSEKRNDIGLNIDNLRGISTAKEFISTKADMNGVSLNSYKVVLPNNIAFVSDTSRRGEKISLAYNDSKITYLVSSITTVFSCDEKNLLAEYLILFLSRKEFDRYARFNSWGSARETFSWEDMCDVKIPIPDIKVQKAIADIYKIYLKRKEINEKLKSRIKSLCPILIKGSLEEGR